MSFIAGYILGCSDISTNFDPRIKMLMAKPTLYSFDIADGWNIRCKMASDIDNCQQVYCDASSGNIQSYVRRMTFYSCVYHYDSFKYAICRSYYPVLTEWFYYYSNGRLQSISEASDFAITSAKLSVKNSSDLFLEISGNGSFSRFKEDYDYDESGNRYVKFSESTVQTFDFYDDNFSGGAFNRFAIINGGTDEFKLSVSGLYNACRNYSG